MSDKKEENKDISDLLNFDAEATVPKEQNGWESQEWTNDQDWNDDKKTKANTKTTKISKQDSWGNDVDEWENWLNDDSTSHKDSPSLKAGKKGD